MFLSLKVSFYNCLFSKKKEKKEKRIVLFVGKDCFMLIVLTLDATNLSFLLGSSCTLLLEEGMFGLTHFFIK